MADRSCRICGVPSKRILCSVQCRTQARRESRKKAKRNRSPEQKRKERAASDASRLRRKPERTCLLCERQFKRLSRGGPEHDKQMFCSRACASEWKRFVSANKQATVVTYFCECGGCGRRFVGARMRQRHCSPTCRELALKAPRRELACCECGRAFFAQGRSVPRSRFCSVGCVKSANRRLPSYKRGKAKARKAGKLRKRGVTVENVDPLRVLERDGWICQLCGVKTPKRLRGTYDDRAPEVDHIIPIAAGGEHSYRNTQCACRQCNIAKGSRPMGQLRLVA